MRKKKKIHGFRGVNNIQLEMSLIEVSDLKTDSLNFYEKLRE